MAERRVSPRGLASSSSSSQTTPVEKQTAREARRNTHLEGNNRRKDEGASFCSTAESSQDKAQVSPSNSSPLKRKRGRDAPSPPIDPPKRRRPSTRHTAEEGPQQTEIINDPLQSWVLNKTWPREYLEADEQARIKLSELSELSERDSWLEDIAAPLPIQVQYREINGFKYPIPIKKVPTSLRRKQSDSSLTGSSNQNNRDSKSTPYRNPRYKILLEAKGSFLHDFGNDESPPTVTKLVRNLLDAEQVVPQESLFRDDIFRRFCQEIEDRNEAMVVQDISRLLVPSAKNLALYGDRHLDILIENVNEAWTECIPVEGPRPQPDYSIGFKKLAFTDEQLRKLSPLIGSVFDTSFFVATYRMYFPFLTCEVKCGAAVLDVADRQNTHSMTIAVRSVVELFKGVNRQKELDREILAFSISHDHQSVRIYGHYPVITGDKVTFYRCTIRKFNFVEMDGREKWTTYKFTKNIYDLWMPTHLRRICSAIDQLPPSLNFEVSDQPETQSEATGLSQDIGGLLSDADFSSQLGQDDDELIPVVQQTTTPDTSVSRGTGQGAAKKAEKNSTTQGLGGRRKG